MGKKLYVGNLPFSATEEELANYFGAAGTVESVRIIMNRETGRPKGFAFIEMGSDDEANKAIEQFNGKDFGGRPLTVNEARPQENRGGGFGGGGGGGRGYGNRGGGRGYGNDRPRW